MRKRRRSIIGSASESWRRTNTKPTPRPTRIARDGERPEPVLRDLLESEDHGQHGDERHHGAGEVEPPGVGVAVLRAGRWARGRAAGAITGRASRKTEPHQKCSSRMPPSTGPIALPAEKAEIQTPMATARCFGSWNMLKMSDRVDGASVAPAMPSERPADDQHLRAGRERGEQRQTRRTRRRR